MDPIRNFKELPNTDTQKCFGCGPTNESGLKMKFFTDDETVWSELEVPAHLCGYSNVVHGGVVSTILDEVMGWAGIYLLKTITMTKTMNIEFIKSVYVNDPLRVEGKVLEITGKREVSIEGSIYNQKGELCARSIGHFVMLTPKLAIRMGVMTQEEIDVFLGPIIYRED